MSTNSPLEIETYTSDGWGQNAYIARARSGSGIVAIDPGGAADAMIARLRALRVPLDAILLTHAHIDHIQGVSQLARETGAPVYLHPGDRPLYDRATEQGLMFGVRIERPPAPDHDITAPSVLSFGDIAFDVRHVPGHSPGHVLFYSAESSAAFVGDVVFASSIGRTDLPGGDYAQLMRSIRDNVLTLPDDTVLYSGHGPETTIAHERVANPFLAPLFGGSGLA